MTDKADDKVVEVTFVDNPHAPEVFADAVTGYFLLNGTISMTFEAARVDHKASPGPVSRVVIGRLRMPVSAAQGLALGLYDYLVKQGLDPSQMGPDERMQ
jgi:hypothetical protein